VNDEENPDTSRCGRIGESDHNQDGRFTALPIQQSATFVRCLFKHWIPRTMEVCRERHGGRQKVYSSNEAGDMFKFVPSIEPNLEMSQYGNVTILCSVFKPGLVWKRGR